MARVYGEGEGVWRGLGVHLYEAAGQMLVLPTLTLTLSLTLTPNPTPSPTPSVPLLELVVALAV